MESMMTGDIILHYVIRLLGYQFHGYWVFKLILLISLFKLKYVAG